MLEERIRAAAQRVNDRAAVDCGIQVRFPGQLDSLSSWLRTLDIYVHAARQEPLGRVLLEAAATGLPVIATNVGGTGEIFPASDESNALRARPFSFQNRQGAFLVPPDDPQKLADALLRLTSGPQAGLWRARMGEQGRRRITERFSNVLAAQTLQSYYILAAGQAAQGVR